MYCTAGELPGEKDIIVGFYRVPLGLLIALSMVFLTGFYMGFPTAFSIDFIGSWLYVRIWISSRESAPREGDTVMGPSIDWQSILGAGVG